MRGAGVAGAATTGGAAGRGATGGAAGGTDAVIDGVAGGGATTTGGAGGRGGTATGAAGLAGATGFSTTGDTTTGRGGAATGGGVTGAAGGTGFAAGGTTTGLATTGGGVAGRAGGGGAAAASFRCVRALSTSPGREMCERSILVLISSSPRRGRADFAAVAGASDEPRRWTLTFSASYSSSELECVFFSVTPTSGSTSRMALLFTSSSLARSLIRTLLIRPFLPRVVLMSSSHPHGVCFLYSHVITSMFACVMTIRLFPKQSRCAASAPSFLLRQIQPRLWWKLVLLHLHLLLP
jgi:hypothetical protein